MRWRVHHVSHLDCSISMLYFSKLAGRETACATANNDFVANDCSPVFWNRPDLSADAESGFHELELRR